MCDIITDVCLPLATQFVFVHFNVHKREQILSTMYRRFISWMEVKACGWNHIQFKKEHMLKHWLLKLNIVKFRWF